MFTALVRYICAYNWLPKLLAKIRSPQMQVKVIGCFLILKFFKSNHQILSIRYPQMMTSQSPFQFYFLSAIFQQMVFGLAGIIFDGKEVFFFVQMVF